MGVSDGGGHYCFIRIALAFYTLISMKLLHTTGIYSS